MLAVWQQQHIQMLRTMLPLEVCLVCVCLVLGLIFRQVPKVPYTVLLLLGGFLFDLIIKLMITAGMTGPEFYAIMGDLDPHVILFVFLPALIFESAFYRICMFFETAVKRFGNGCAWCVNGNCFDITVSQYIMYGPNGACLASQCDKQTVPWSIEMSLLMGAILSATDPVPLWAY